MALKILGLYRDKTALATVTPTTAPIMAATTFSISFFYHLQRFWQEEIDIAMSIVFYSRMAKRKKPKQIDSFQKFMNGEPVKVVRSMIWTGYAGEVVKFQGGLHVVKLNTKPNGKPCSPFHAEILGAELETHL